MTVLTLLLVVSIPMLIIAAITYVICSLAKNRRRR
jgi:hypothetical protein